MDSSKPTGRYTKKMKFPGLANALHHPSFTASKIDKEFRVPFMIFLFFGYNYLDSTLLNARVLRIIVNLYCLLAVSTSFVIMAYHFVHAPSSPYILIVIEYIITTFMTSITSRAYKVFFSNMESIDSRLQAGDEFYKKLRNMHYVFAVIVVASRAMYTGVVCVMFYGFCSEKPVELLTINYVIIAVEFNQLPRVVVFSFIRHRMHLILKKIEGSPPGISIIVKGGDSNCVNHYLSYLDIYRELVDNVDIVARNINPMLMVSLMCCFPKMMILIYRLLLHSYDGISAVYVSLMAVEAVQWGILVCLPGFVNEQISAETEKIKIALVHQRLDCKNERTRAQISEFLNYLEARPYKYSIWRVIRVDVSLPVGLLSLCTTYLIVMIQFSHLLE